MILTGVLKVPFDVCTTQTHAGGTSENHEKRQSGYYGLDYIALKLPNTTDECKPLDRVITPSEVAYFVMQ
jgi:hypothetical protein